MEHDWVFTDFCEDEWNRNSHPMKKDAFGVFEIFLPDLADGSKAIPHNTKVKVRTRVQKIVDACLTLFSH